MEPRNPLQTAAAGPFWKPRADCREGGSYVLGRISRDFDDFLRRGPPCGLGAEAAFKAKMGYETPKPAANGCNGFLFWETPDRLPEGGIYVPGRISRNFDVFLRGHGGSRPHPGEPPGEKYRAAATTGQAVQRQPMLSGNG